MRVAAGFLLIVGFFWALFVAWMFLTLAGIAQPPRLATPAILYWFGMMLGPLVLISGAALLLRKRFFRRGAILVTIGCAMLTAFALYNTIIGVQRKPLQAPPPYLFYAVLLLVMLLSDAAAYRVYRGVRKGQKDKKGTP